MPAKNPTDVACSNTLLFEPLEREAVRDQRRRIGLGIYPDHTIRVLLDDVQRAILVRRDAFGAGQTADHCTGGIEALAVVKNLKERPAPIRDIHAAADWVFNGTSVRKDITTPRWARGA